MYSPDMIWWPELKHAEGGIYIWWVVSEPFQGETDKRALMLGITDRCQQPIKRQSSMQPGEGASQVPNPVLPIRI